MANIILMAVYFMIPAYLANMAPVFSRRILRSLAIPIDKGKKLGGKPIFGSHKTVRGFLVAVIYSVALTYLQALLYPLAGFQALSIVHYPSVWLSLGLLLGVGAIGGDLVKSFAKRRIGIKPGKTFIPFDQLDFVIGSLLLASLVVEFTLPLVFTILTVSFFGHLAVNYIGYLLKVRDQKW
ncbi:CDP-archaeol synthase [Candidatus Woesearchaeota archaeon]|nr:CDP-archaeol synthase [Candidatus Woesearchaeota archaeon]